MTTRLPRFDKSHETVMFSFSFAQPLSVPPPPFHPLLETRFAQDVLYPSEDVEEQLSLLSVYPEPAAADGSAAEGPDGDSTGVGPTDPAAPSRDQSSPGEAGAAAAAAATTGGGGGLQEKTDEVLKSITGSFATVTDIFGGRPPGGGVANSAAAGEGGAGAAGAAASKQDRFGEGADGGDGGASSGWDLFKPPSMAEMKRRLGDITAGTGGLSLSPPKAPPISPAGQGSAPDDAPAAASLSVRRTGGRSVSPARQDGAGAGTASAGLAKFGEGWRDFRRRSAEAVEEAVTKLKTALDDSDDEAAAEARVAARIAEKGRVRAAASRARNDPAAAASAGDSGAGGGEADDPFWKPFGEGGGGDDGTPVPLPTAEEVRRGRAAAGGRSALAARKELDAFYGGGGGGM